MSNPTSNFGWQMPTATDLVTDLPADFEVFGQAVDTDLADLNGGTTGQILSKTSATDLDFTWVTPNAGDITGVTAGTGISGGGTSGDVTVTNSMATAIDAKGDLIAGTGADAFSRLAVGTNGQVLTANSAAATGLEYTTISAGGMTLINSGGTTLTGASVSISSIPATYKELYIYLENALPATDDTQIRMRFNSDSSTVYSSIRSVDTALIKNNNAFLSLSFNISNTAATKGTATVRIPNYFNTVAPKNYFCFSHQTYASDNTQWLYSQVTGVYNSTSAISSITLFPSSGNWTSGTAYVYGVK